MRETATNALFGIVVGLALLPITLPLMFAAACILAAMGMYVLAGRLFGWIGRGGQS